MKSTRDDVARLAGVSAATVSYVMNEGPRTVSAETREKVRRAIQTLDYRPSAVARSLRLQRTFTIGLIVPDTHNPCFAEIARGVEHAAFEHDYTIVLCHSGYDLHRELQYLDVLHDHRVAGLIWIPAARNPDPVRKLLEYGMPVVILHRQTGWDHFISIVPDNIGGGYLGTKHLLEHGHARIGCIAQPPELDHSQTRFQGYQAALRDAGLPIEDKWIARGGFRMADGKRAALVLLTLPDPPTAIFAYNDTMAIGALRAAYDQGLRVPQDLSIVGFDDIPQAAFTCPGLTTVSQPKFEMGRQGVELLLSQVTGQPIASRPENPLRVELIVRESTAPPSRR